MILSEFIKEEISCYLQKISLYFQNRTKKITINGAKYELYNSQYSTLKQILKEINMDIKDMKFYNECHFGIEINNKEITKFRSNYLGILPKAITDLESLKELDLEGNQLTSLPDSIGNLSSLEKLYLSDNQLTTLPQTIANLTKLKELDLRYNFLASLPKNIKTNAIVMNALNDSTCFNELYKSAEDYFNQKK